MPLKFIDTKYRYSDNNAHLLQTDNSEPVCIIFCGTKNFSHISDLCCFGSRF